MTRPNASLSNIELACTLSQKLACRPLPLAQPSKRFIAFSASACLGHDPIPRISPPSSSPLAETRPPDSSPIEPGAFTDWDSVCGWSQRVAKAKTVFVMDSQGFVLSKSGSWSYDDAEAMGTQLMVALERFDQMDSFHKRAQAVSVRFRSFWLTGIRVPPDSQDHFTLGVLSTEPVDYAILQALSDQVSAKAKEL